MGDVVALEQGWAINRKNNHLIVDEGIPLLRITDLINNTESKFVNPDLIAPKFIAKPTDIIFTRTGQVGHVFMGRRGVVHNNCFRVLPNNIVDAKYLFWFLRQPQVVELANALATGAAQKDLGHSAFKTIGFRYPPLPTQRRIASILSAYDDLIENNTRRIEILEEMARSLYREWFVQFRFPGHEKVKLVDSELGKIPEGWEVAELESHVALRGGYAFKSTEFSDGGEFPLVTIKNVQDGRFEPTTTSRLALVPPQTPKHCHLRDGDMLLSLTGNVGRVCLVYGADRHLLNQRVALIEPKKRNRRAWAYCTFRSVEFFSRLTQLSNGVAQQNLSPVQTGKMPILSPTETMLDEFESRVSDSLSLVVCLYNKNTILRQTRDLLLPKLISGEIDVDSLDLPERS